MDEIKEVTYHAFYEDGSFVQFENLDSATKAKPRFTAKMIRGTWKNGPYTNSEYDFNFFDADGNSISKIKEGNWSLINLKVTADNWFNYNTIGFDLVDPLGKVKQYKFTQTLEGIKGAYNFLKQMSLFESLENYLIQKENEALKIRVEELEVKIEALTADLIAKDNKKRKKTKEVN